METSEKRRIAIPRQLQLNDTIYSVVAFPMNKKLNFGDLSVDLEWFDVKPTTIVGLKWDPTKEGNILVNENISLPADGELYGSSKIILNEDDARKAVLEMYDKETKKLKGIMDKLQAAQKAYTALQKVLKTKPLNKEGIDVEVVEKESDNE